MICASFLFFLYLCMVTYQIKQKVMLEEILAYNKRFVENKGYEAYITNKYPDKKIAILSCMDTRLTALLPAALGIKNGDLKMKFVIQRVNHASVTVDGQTVGSIDKGLLILFGAGKGDTEEMLPKFVDKITKLRIFSDENDKINLSLLDVGGELLVVSQFTLYADCRKGNRPSFFDALEPDRADALYEKFVALCREKVTKVETGSFGAHMRVDLENDGPFTVVLDSRDFFKESSNERREN